MEITFFGNGSRGVSCLQALLENGYKINLVVIHPTDKNTVKELAKQKGITTFEPDDPNSEEALKRLSSLGSDLFVLAGYGKIFYQQIINIPKIMCLNLHGGKLPQRRGSSPMNWALINGDKSFTLSIIKVATGVDCGDVLVERTFNIDINDTIRDLHKIANEHFPVMLLEAVEQIANGTYQLRVQNNIPAAYYPLRFPDDGLILWDMNTAEEIHNCIRALTEPYPCAFTFYNNRRIKLLASELNEYPFYGEPGRIYQKTKRGILVCASDRCLWIKSAVFDDNGQSILDEVNRYDRLATVRWLTIQNMNKYENKFI